MRNKRADDFFSEADRVKIREAVATVERQTAGEVAVMVVDESDRYLEAVTLGALFLAAGIALVVALAIHQVTIWLYLPLVFATYFPARCLVFKFPRLKLAFIGGRRFAEAVRDRAVRAFFEKRLHKTRHETGILIFISLFERRVWILGDRGINAKIPPDWWEKCALELAAGIREGRSRESLCTVIEKCGAELKKHFPRPGDDSNELPNEILFD